MEKYDDFLIVNPEKMESIAREYQKALSNIIKSKTKNELSPQESLSYRNLQKNIFNLQNTLQSINKLWGLRFYGKKQQVVKNILQKIQNLPKTKCPQHLLKNYCEAVSCCIEQTSMAIENCVKIITEFNFAASTEIIEIMQILLTILPMLSSLFGTCKYRW